MGWRLAIDFGTTATAAVTATEHTTTPLALDGAGRMPSSVYSAPPDGVLLVGEQADHSAGYGFERYQPTPKRHISRSQIRLGDRSYTPTELIAAILRRVAAEAVTQHNGERPAAVILTHPVAWSTAQRTILSDALHAANPDLPDPVFTEEPVAAAQWYARPADHEPPQSGDHVAIYDLGGGTFDVAVLQRTRDDFVVRASGGANPLGGFDFDYRLFTFLGDRHIGPADPRLWQDLQHPSPDDVDIADRRRRMQTAVRWLKEGLSTHTSLTVPLPGVNEPVLVTRQEYEDLISADVQRTVEVLLDTLDDAGVKPTDLAALYLVGGAARTPLVGAKLQALRVPLQSRDDPKLVVALGACVAVSDQEPIAAEPATPVLDFPPSADELAPKGASDATPAAIHGEPKAPDNDSLPPERGGNRKRWLAVTAAGLVLVAAVTGAAIWFATANNDQRMVLPFSGLTNPDSIAVADTGTVYVSDLHGVSRLPAGAASSTPIPGLPGFSELAVDNAGAVYASGVDRVLKLAAGASTPTDLNIGDADPGPIAVGGDRTVYLAMYGYVLKLPPNAPQPTVLPFSNISLAGGIAVDAEGAVYVTAFVGSPDPGATYQLLKLPAGASAPTKLPFEGVGELYGVAVDGNGTVYVVAESDDHSGPDRILRLPAGAATFTEFAFIRDIGHAIAVDQRGDIYVFDDARVARIPGHA